ncbi:15348_t:CDS:2 [Entrophospora sp. SA101]|nr:15348_t:CDS:2 [Entrophospora sp. SA101]
MSEGNTGNNNSHICIICNNTYNSKDKFKKSLIFNIKKKLTLNHKSLGKKSLTIPCSEGMFLNIFKDEIQRYSPARHFYLCSFMGEEGDEKLRDLLGSEDWAIRYYDNNQYAYVDIINNQIKVVWKEVGLVEANGSSISSSNIIISFSTYKGSH